MKTIALVTGAAGTVGKAFIDALEVNNVPCIGISRRPIESSCQILIANLINYDQTVAGIQELGLDNYERIILVHTVGGFKFESKGKPDIDCDHDGIDDEVYCSNVNTFKNIVGSLLATIQDWQELVVVNIGSISDKYDIPWWRSYSRAKNRVRADMQKLAIDGLAKCVFLSVSTVITDKECSLRPFADTTYWLTPEQLAKKAVPYLVHSPKGYVEIEIFEPMPGFDPVLYHLDSGAIKKRWKHEMGKDPGEND